MDLSKSIIDRRDYLVEWIRPKLKDTSVDVYGEDDTVQIWCNESQICGIRVEEECYQFYGINEGWYEQTEYLCEKVEDGTWSYYVDSADECIAESTRIVHYRRGVISENANKDEEVGLSNRDRIKKMIGPIFESSGYRLDTPMTYKAKLINIEDRKTSELILRLWCHDVRIDVMIPRILIWRISEGVELESNCKGVVEEELEKKPCKTYKGINEKTLFSLMRNVASLTQ